jgi:short-subunit dehydrogenase
MELRGAAAVVTGASRGIGRATALALAARGANVALGARSVEDLERVAGELRARGAEALVVPLDVSRREDCERLVQAASERWGWVDVVVANAGVYLRTPVLELTAEDVRRSLEVNFFGELHPILAALPQMVERRSGAIVVVSSLDGRHAMPGDAPYAIAKGALGSLVQVLRQELGPLGIGVTGVFPGRVVTEMIADLRPSRLGGAASPERVARAIVRAVERGRPEVILPRFNRLLLYADAATPRLTEWAIRSWRLGGRWVGEGTKTKP